MTSCRESGNSNLDLFLSDQPCAPDYTARGVMETDMIGDRAIKKRQHFVPQFYLRRFATLEPSEVIWTYDTMTGDVRPSTVDATAFERYLYAVTLEDGTRLNDLEDFLADIEGSGAPVLAKLISGAPISDQERANFASFMATMYVRTDAFRHEYATLAMNLAQLQIYATASHDGAFRTFAKRYQQDHGPMSGEEIAFMRDVMRRPQDFTISVDKEWTLRAFMACETLAPIFDRMRWTVMRTSGQHFFVTSDNPVVFKVPRDYQNRLLGNSLKHPKVEVTFPLSSATCLLATWDADNPTLCNVEPEDVKFANRVRSVYARRFLFARQRDSGILRLAMKYKDTKTGTRLEGFGPPEYSPVELRRTKQRD
jgi:hypothetical protein